MNKEIMKAMGFEKQVALVDLTKYPEINQREFRISGLCKNCQDETFKEPSGS